MPGISDKALRARLDSMYRNLRGTELGFDSRLTSRDLTAWLGHKGAQKIRAVLQGHPTAYIGERFRAKSSSKLSLGVGVSIGANVTIDSLSFRGVRLGDNSTIDDYAVLRGSGVVRHLGEGIDIGARSAIGAYNVVLGQGGVFIGDDCLFGPNVTVLSENHNFQDIERPIRTQGETRLPTNIGNDVWVGAGAVILGGSQIGDGVVVAAGAVVRGEIEPYTIVAGVPARHIRSRKVAE